MTENTQYKWRQRKKRKSLFTIWIVVVIVLSALGAFFYEGLKVSNPMNVAKQYLEDGIGVSEYELTAGPRSLNDQNVFQQEYTVKYTADGKEEVKKLNLVQQDDKKYGIFEQWDFEKAAESDRMEVKLIAPVSSQVLVNGVAPTDSEIKIDEAISPGAICYDLTGVEVGAKLQVNGLPFDSYETTITEKDTELDVREQLVVGENAKTQMSEMAKTMINELFTAVVQGQKADSLSKLFDQTPNKANLFKAMKKNLFNGDDLKVSSITFKDFKPEFGEVYYPAPEEDAFIGMNMTLNFTCEYTLAENNQEESEETDTAEETAESETETEAKKAPTKVSVSKKADFYFKYVDGKCVVTSMEVPTIIS